MDCLTAELVEAELKKAVADSIEAWYDDTNPTSAQIAEWIASADERDDYEFGYIWTNLVFSIVLDYLAPLVNRTRSAVTDEGVEAEDFFTKWHFYIK